jgi:hypothetical protein
LVQGKGIEDPMKIADNFIKRHPPPAYESEAEQKEHGAHLILPVVIPQRRPEARVRGFIRAYDPTLEQAYIDQAMFLEFIQELNIVCLPNPWINAINFASFATMALPTVTELIISRVINQISKVGLEMHSRTK